jgi:hypothetical protein
MSDLSNSLLPNSITAWPTMGMELYCNFPFCLRKESTAKYTKNPIFSRISHISRFKKSLVEDLGNPFTMPFSIEQDGEHDQNASA